MRDDFAQPLSVLMGMVALTLLIACANVAMLLMARNSARQREFCLRMALGESRFRFFGQLLTESLILLAGGAALGWFFSIWSTRALASWAQLDLDLTPDHRVLVFAVAISLAAGLFFGLAPLQSVVRAPVGLVLKSSASNIGQDRKKMLGGRVVVALQIAICLVLLTGTGLLVRTLQNLEHVNLGLRTAGLFVFGINPQQAVHSDEESKHFFRDLLDRVRALPGVESVTMMAYRMGGDASGNTDVEVEGVPPLGPDESAMMRWDSVGPNFFTTLEIPLLMGRDFNEADSPDSEKVAVVNQAFAVKYLPHQNPLGHHIAFRGESRDSFTVIGVSADNKYMGVKEKEQPIAYFSCMQLTGMGTMHIELRTRGNPQSVLPELQAAMRAIAPDLPMLHPTTQQAQFEETISQERIVARLAMFFGLLAVVLVATGLYGTLSYRVTRRTPEIGVRMAVGAQRGQILRMILRESMTVCLAGVAIGLPLASASMRLLRTMLYGLGPNDPASFAAAFLGIAVVALASSLIPARRAASVDPLVALHEE